MRDFGIIHTRFWEWAQEAELSDQSKLVAAYLLTCRHSNSLGCFRIPKEYVSADLGYSIDRVSKAYQELIDTGFLLFCDRSKYAFLPKYLRWNPPQNPKHAKGILKLVQQLPSTFSLHDKLLESCEFFLVPYLDQDGINTLYHTLSIAYGYTDTDTDTDTDTERDRERGSQSAVSLSTNNSVPLREIQELWNSILEEYSSPLPRLAKLTQNTQRYKHIRARWKEYPDINAWQIVFSKAAQSDFLNGRVKQFQASFDWLVKSADNFQKTYEGNFDNKEEPAYADAQRAPF